MVLWEVPRHFMTKAGVPATLVVSRMKVLLAAPVVEVISVGRLRVVPSRLRMLMLFALIKTTLLLDALRKLKPDVPPAKVSVDWLPAVPQVTSPEQASDEAKVLPAVAK